MKAMVLAAGLGTRLKPYTSICPKPLFPVMGEPLVLRIVNNLRQSGFTEIVVNAYHLQSQIVELLGKEPDLRVQVEPFELGTGGGLRMAFDSLGPGPVLVTNADIYHEIDYRWVYENYCRQNSKATLVMHDYPRFNKVPVSADGEIGSFTGDGSCGIDSKIMAFTGIHVLDTDLLKSIPEQQFYSIIDTYSSFLEDGGTINALIARQTFWQDIGTPADYLDLHRHLLAERSQVALERHRHDNFSFGPGVVMGEGVTLQDWGYLGANVDVGAGSHLERVVVWDDVKIPHGTIAKDAIIT